MLRRPQWFASHNKGVSAEGISLTRNRLSTSFEAGPLLQLSKKKRPPGD
jgi:hypothetical protein